MTGSLDGPRLKLNRAREHLDPLHEWTDLFTEAERERITPEFNEETGCKDFWLDPRPTPPRWGPMVGDVLYNCRSALDHLANQLAGGRLNDHDTCWPILTNPDDFATATKPFISRLSDDAVAFLEESQPYNRRHQFARNDTLAILNTLSNADKHRHLHVGVVNITSAWTGNLDIREMYGGPMEHRAKIASVAVAGPEVDVPLQFDLQVAFAHYRRWNGPIRVIAFLADAITDIDGLFGRAASKGLIAE